jgi:hypothetical protein
MANNFVDFPRTPHLYGREVYREDLQLSEEDTTLFLSQNIIIQEKIDATNIGVSLDRSNNPIFQKRGSKISPEEIGSSKEFSKLAKWYEIHEKELQKVLGRDKILFGEWCYAQHTTYYDQLPSYFMAFDIFDKEMKQFISLRQFQHTLSPTQIQTVPVLYDGRITSREDLDQYLVQSSFGPDIREGLYLRIDSRTSNERRAKLVRPEFLDQIDLHHRNKPLQLNKSLDDIEKLWSM